MSGVFRSACRTIPMPSRHWMMRSTRPITPPIAAQFLTQLKGQTGRGIPRLRIIIRPRPDLGLPYQRRVLAAWHGLGDVPSGMEDAAFAMAVPDPVVILQSPEARRVHVYTMEDPPSAGLARGLPRVISP